MLDETSFCIEIDYDRYHSNASHVFEALAEFSTAFESLDRDLASVVFPNIRVRLVLDEVQSGSILSFFITILESVDGDDLRDLNWKRILGKFLVAAKERLLEYLKSKEKVESLREIQDLREELFQLAQETGLNELGAYSELNDAMLLYRIEQIAIAVDKLEEDDKAVFISSTQRIEFNPEFEISKDEIQELLTEVSRRQEVDALLRVKKPDYLGQSRWDVQHDGHAVQVKIIDENWLKEFQSRKFDLRPGDSLHARTVIEVWYDANGNVLDERYTVLKVYRIVPAPDTPDLWTDEAR